SWCRFRPMKEKESTSRAGPDEPPYCVLACKASCLALRTLVSSAAVSPVLGPGSATANDEAHRAGDFGPWARCGPLTRLHRGGRMSGDLFPCIDLHWKP